jgi:DNA-binding transcriptional ArsR family regulator
MLAGAMADLHDNAERATALLKAMANPSRLMVLCQLAEGGRSVGELERTVGLSQSALSQHLALLRRTGLVSTRRSGQSIIYALSSREAIAVMRTLQRVICPPAEAAARKSAGRGARRGGPQR